MDIKKRYNREKKSGYKEKIYYRRKKSGYKEKIKREDIKVNIR